MWGVPVGIVVWSPVGVVVSGVPVSLVVWSFPVGIVVWGIPVGLVVWGIPVGIVVGGVPVGIMVWSSPVGIVVLVGVVVSIVVWESMGWNAVLHLSSDEDLGESKTNGVTELIVVLVVPLGHGVHELVVDILSIDDEVVLNMEDEVPWVGESLGHGAELVEVSSNSSLALLEVISNIVDDGSEVLNGVENSVEGGVLELINNSTESLPSVLGITEALNTVWDLSLDGTSEKTLEDLSHSEEGEVNI